MIGLDRYFMQRSSHLWISIFIPKSQVYREIKSINDEFSTKYDKKMCSHECKNLYWNQILQGNAVDSRIKFPLTSREFMPLNNCIGLDHYSSSFIEKWYEICNSYYSPLILACIIVVLSLKSIETCAPVTQLETTMTSEASSTSFN